MQCALSYNGFASVISAFWNSLKYCFFSLYLNPTNGYHYHRSTSARTNHTSENRHLYSDTLLFSFLITEKTSNQYPLSQNSERLPSFSLIFQPLPPNTKITASPITTNQNLKCEPQNQPNKIQSNLSVLSNLSTFKFLQFIICTGNQWMKGHQINLK